MMHVVDIWPGKEKMDALGLVEKNIRVDPDAYRHYVEQFNLKFAEFIQKGRGNGPAEKDDLPAGNPKERIAAADEGLLAAFEQSQAPFSYYQGGFYRYRVDRFGDADRPIILERVERSEITGPAGIDGYLSRKGLLMLIANRIERWLSKRQEIG
jgi:hypothetical protein